ncbi:MAG: nuclear transport factor 2 family protein [Acidimicrobiia bacterium]
MSAPTDMRADIDIGDKLRLRELIEAWVVWRDAGLWDEFLTLWADDGRMMATWTQGTAQEFVDMNKAGWAEGVRILHFLGGSTIQVSGPRAISQTKMTISQRAPVHDVEVDVVCTGRFYDFWRKDDGDWKLVLRQPIYEKDRMDAVDPHARLELDGSVLEAFPYGYRHLAYLQHGIGYPVKRDMPGIDGPEVERLYADGTVWLTEGRLDR